MTKQEFIELLEEALEKDESTIKMEDIFRDYEEWDSLAALSVLAMVREEYDFQIPRTDFDKLQTVQELYDYVEAKTS